MVFFPPQLLLDKYTSLLEKKERNLKLTKYIRGLCVYKYSNPFTKLFHRCRKSCLWFVILKWKINFCYVVFLFSIFSHWNNPSMMSQCIRYSRISNVFCFWKGLRSAFLHNHRCYIDHQMHTAIASIESRWKQFFFRTIGTRYTSKCYDEYMHSFPYVSNGIRASVWKWKGWEDMVQESASMRERERETEGDKVW